MTTGGNVIGEAVLRLVGDRTQLNRDIDSARNSVQRFQGSLRTAAAGAAGIAALTAGAVKLGDTFARADRIILAGTGATGEALAALQQDFRAVYRQVPGDAQVMAQVLADVNTRLGLTGEELQRVTANAVNMGRVMGVDAAGFVNDLSGAMEIFNEDSSNATQIMDELLVISQQTGIGLDALASNLRTYGPVMRNAGFSTRETAIVMGQMHRNGVDLSRVMPGLNAFFRRAAENGEDLQVALFNTVTQIQRATTDTGALTVATEAFGAEGAQRLATAIRNEAFELDNLEPFLEDATGATEQLGNENFTAEEKMRLFIQRMETAAGPVGALGQAVGATVLPLALMAASMLFVASSGPAVAAGNAIAAASMWVFRASGLAALTSTILLYAWWGLAQARAALFAVGNAIAAAAANIFSLATLRAVVQTIILYATWALARARAVLFLVGSAIAAAGANIFSLSAIRATATTGAMYAVWALARARAVAFLAASAIAAAGAGIFSGAATTAIGSTLAMFGTWAAAAARAAGFSAAVGAIANPITAVIASITAFISAIFLMWVYWDQTRAIANRVWGGIGEVIRNVVNNIINTLARLVNRVVGFINSLLAPVNAALRALGLGEVRLSELRTDFDVGVSGARGGATAALTSLSGGLPGLGLLPQIGAAIPGIANAGDLPGRGVAGNIRDFIGRNTPSITINGDVYGFDDFAEKVGEANLRLDRRGLGGGGT